MLRDYSLYLQDILTAIETIERFIAGLDVNRFAQDELRLHGVLYNMMTIGEAVKNLPADVQSQAPFIRWNDIARFRDKLVHHYFTIKPHLIWQFIHEDFPSLKTATQALLDAINDKDTPE